MSDDELGQWVDRRVKWLWRWATYYGVLHDFFSLASWIIAIAVPFGLAAMLYLPQEQARSWNMPLLLASGAGLVLQVVTTVMRFKDRANNGWKAAASLESMVLAFRQGVRTKEELLKEIDQLLKQHAERQAP